jgi:uncharacterized protein YoxC
MMPLLTQTLLLQAAAASDTVITRLVGSQLSGLQKVLAVAEIGAVVLAYALIGALLFAALKVAKAIEASKDEIKEVRRDIHDLVRHMNGIVESSKGIVDSVRHGIEHVQETADYANQRVKRAVGDLADRVDEFNRTITLVQSETQDVVIAALSAVRGVRAGMTALKRKRPKETRGETGNGDFRVDTPARPRLKRRAHAEP